MAARTIKDDYGVVVAAGCTVGFSQDQRHQLVIDGAIKAKPTRPNLNLCPYDLAAPRTIFVKPHLRRTSRGHTHRQTRPRAG